MTTILKHIFYFVRHAQTDWNVQKLCQGQKDIPLNAQGVEEAHHFAKELEGGEFDSIVSSSLTRAMQTAKAIKARTGVPLYTLDTLAERGWGALEGMSSQEMYEIERLEEESPSFCVGQGVEARHAFRERVCEAVARAQTYSQKPLIVSHGRVFHELCLALEIEGVRQVPNCQLVKVYPTSNSWKITIL